MTPDQIETIIYQARDAWINGDAKGFSALFHPDGVLIVPGQQWQGQEAISQSLAEFAATHTEVNIQIHRILIDGHCAVIEWSWQEMEKATGKRSQAEDAIVIEFKDGLIQRWREYIDLESPKNSLPN